MIFTPSPDPNWLQHFDPTPIEISKSRLSGFTASIWIPTLNGFATPQIKLAANDPLSGQEAFANTILEVLRDSRRTFKKPEMLATLQSQGLIKEPQAMKKALTLALDQLRRRGLASSVKRRWIAASFLKGGRAMKT